MEMHLEYKISVDVYTIITIKKEADMTGISIGVKPRMIVVILFEMNGKYSKFLDQYYFIKLLI
jgi:hypothetical protein